MFWPSTHPSSLIDRQNGFVETDVASSCALGAGPIPRIPTRAIFFDSCASTASGAARTLTTTVPRNVRRFTVCSSARSSLCGKDQRLDPNPGMPQVSAAFGRDPWRFYFPGERITSATDAGHGTPLPRSPPVSEGGDPPLSPGESHALVGGGGQGPPAGPWHRVPGDFGDDGRAVFSRLRGSCVSGRHLPRSAWSRS